MVDFYDGVPHKKIVRTGADGKEETIFETARPTEEDMGSARDAEREYIKGLVEKNPELFNKRQ